MIFTRRNAERIRTVFGRIFISTDALSSVVFIFMEIVDKFARGLAGSDNDKSSNESTTDFNESTKHSNRLLRSSIHFYILIGEGQPSHVFETVLQLTACN